LTNETKRYLRHFDWSILIILMGLAFFSYIGIEGANPRYGEETKQLLWYGVGFVAMGLVLFFDYQWLNQFSYIFYGLGILLLIGVLIFGPVTNNTTSWFDVGGVKIQPAEFMKLFIILSVARWFAKRKEKELEFRAFYQLWPVFLLFGVPFLLIVIQPDLGNAVVLMGIFIPMLIVAGVRLRHFVYLGIIGLMGVATLAFIYLFHRDLFFEIIEEYQWRRITSFLNPQLDVQGAGYQLNQSLIAIGSGTLEGKGFSGETLSNNNWVPYAETDFVFSVIGEKFGFIGGSLLLLLFFLLIYRMIRIAMETENLFGSYVISGIIGLFVFQIFENIGMTIGLMPITGITLPFISYGGSSLLTNMVMIGIVLNIGMRRKKLMF
jgi:rod shape determining protein RodA